MFKRRKDEEPDMAEPSPAAPGTGAQNADTGVGVPPFRPAAGKDAPRPVFGGATQPTPTIPGGAPRAPGAPAMPGARPSTPLREGSSERRTLVVGRGISVQGMVQDAERLVVEGQVEATMIHATELSVSPGGLFKGEVQVEDAEIAGTIDGTVNARGSLVVRGTGVVLGTARCRRLQVEDGGQITGRIEMITEAKAVARPVAEAAQAS